MERIRRKTISKKIARKADNEEQAVQGGSPQVQQTLQLQRTMGNQAVQRMIAQQTGGPRIQRALFGFSSATRMMFGGTPIHSGIANSASGGVSMALADGKGYSLLKQFAATEYSTENFTVLEAISDYMRNPKASKAQSIFSTYIDPSSDQQVNVAGSEVRKIKDAISKNAFDAGLFQPAITAIMLNILDTFERASISDTHPFATWYAGKVKNKEDAQSKADAKDEKKKAKDAEDKRVLDYGDLKVGQRSIIGANLLPKLHGILRLILASAEGYRLFNAYAKAEMSEENLMLLEVISDYLDSPSREGAESIANVFIRPGSTYEVNLPNKARQQMLDVIDSPYTGADGNDGPAIDAGLFDKIIDATVTNVFDTYSRIVGSQLDEAVPLREWIAKQDASLKKANDKKFNGWGARLKKRFGR